MKKIVRILFVLTIFLTTGSVNAAPILAASGNFGGHMYEVYADYKIAWNEANTFALSIGGYLTSIADAAENTFVSDLVDDDAGLGQVWAGGFQTAQGAATANWAWANGETWDYINWNPGEPNDYYGDYSEEYLGINWTSDGKWNDEGNLGNIHGFVVETAVPEPSIIALFAAGLFGLSFARRRKQS